MHSLNESDRISVSHKRFVTWSTTTTTETSFPYFLGNSIKCLHTTFRVDFVDVAVNVHTCTLLSERALSNM